MRTREIRVHEISTALAGSDGARRRLADSAKRYLLTSDPMWNIAVELNKNVTDQISL